MMMVDEDGDDDDGGAAGDDDNCFPFFCIKDQRGLPSINSASVSFSAFVHCSCQLQGRHESIIFMSFPHYISSLQVLSE